MFISCVARNDSLYGVKQLLSNGVENELYINWSFEPDFGSDHECE